MIITVTPNPAIDKTLVLEHFQPGQVHKALRSRQDVGGKGINVAKNIRTLGGEAVCLGFLGSNAHFFLPYLQSLGLVADFTPITAHTRVNIKIVVGEPPQVTEINEAGPAVSPAEAAALRERISAWAPRSPVLVLAGSLPPGLPTNFYHKVIEDCRPLTPYIILDASGEALLTALPAAPFMIKPNLPEFCALLGRQVSSPAEIAEAAQKLLAMGISVITVSLGAEGSVTVTREGSFFLPPLPVTVRSTVGAGDAMVAGFALALSQNLPLSEALRLGAAAASAAIAQEGSAPAEKKQVDALRHLVKIEKIA